MHNTRHFNAYSVFYFFGVPVHGGLGPDLGFGFGLGLTLGQGAQSTLPHHSSARPSSLAYSFVLKAASREPRAVSLELKEAWALKAKTP